MKLFTKVSIALITVTFLFISCKCPPPCPPCPNGSSINDIKYDQDSLPKIIDFIANPQNDPIIEITDANISTGELILSDHGLTKAKTDNVVFWKIQTIKVTEIVEISMKDLDGNINVFIPYEPRRITLNNKKSDWRGRINPLLAIPKNQKARYIYKIIWKDGNNQEHTYDPTIEVYK